ncbi:MAG: DUF2877 domain-containing protein [Candidatus Eisenbacteria bacterium]|nr:DUF2877 domain-containing protein [Candidatus Eisenbacteria bacterium]
MRSERNDVRHGRGRAQASPAVDGPLRLVSRGDMIADGLYRTHSSFRRAANMTDGRGVVSMVELGVEPGPVNLVMRHLSPGTVRTLRVDGASIIVNGAAVATQGARDYSSKMDVGATDPEPVHRGLRMLRRLLAQRAPAESLAFLVEPSRTSAFRGGFRREFVRHMRACADDILHGDPFRGAARASGCGFGLTPSGDDLVVGVLVAMNLAERVAGGSLAVERRMIRRAAGTGGLVNETALCLAESGRVFETMKELLRALTRDNAFDLSRAVDRIVAVGETSGADTTVGLLLGTERWLFRRNRPRGLPGRDRRNGVKSDADRAAWGEFL